MEKRRIFVGCLPHEIDEKTISKKFSKYGEVLSIDLKHRYGGLNENDIISTFAFVDFQSSRESLSACMEKLAKKKWSGKEVTIQLAKESVLSRLENERKTKINLNQEGNNDSEKDKNVFDSGEQFKFKLMSTESKPAANGTECSSNILSKLEMFSDVWKDCDDFQGSKLTPQNSDSKKFTNEEAYFQKSMNMSDNNSKNLINSKREIISKDFSKHLAVSSEERRQKSVEQMKQAIDQRKLLVKKALSSVDSSKTNKKIIFNDDDFDDPGKNVGLNSQQKNSNSLFNDDSADEEELPSFKVKQHFEGEKGKKLFQLQSKFGNDTRFVMDERFHESDEEKVSNNAYEGKQDVSKRFIDKNNQDDGNETVNDEIKKQLEILQSIVGDKDIAKKRIKQKDAKQPLSAAGVRFDPSAREHEKYIVKPSELGAKENLIDKSKRDIKKNKNKNKEIEELNQEEESEKVEVSKDTFYEVADELKNTFKSNQKSSFSFSELFKSSTGDHKVKEKNTNFSSSSQMKNAPYNNKFTDDRFGGDFSSEYEKPRVEKNKIENSSTQLGSLWNENFFYDTNDPRLEEAQQFFSRENLGDMCNFGEKRKELKKIIKKKVMNKTRNERPFKKKIGRSSNKKNFKRRKLQ